MSIVAIILNLKGLFVLLMSIIFLEDKISFKAVICIIICFFGAILLIKPSLIFTISSSQSESKYISIIKLKIILDKSSMLDPNYFLGCILALTTCSAKTALNIWIRKFGNIFM